MLKRPSADTVAENPCECGDGCPPTVPAANCTFCPRTAASTWSPTGRSRAACPGSSQMFIAYSRAELLGAADARNARDLVEHARADDVVERVAVDRAGFSERSATTIRKPALALATTTPCWITSVGRRGVASATLFCICTCAMSGSVPVSNVSVMPTQPLELDVELK